MFGKSAVMDSLRAVAEGKIACECGNDDWRGFFYVSAGDDGYVGGCKRCGRAYVRRTSGEWRLMGGPAPVPAPEA